MVTYHYQPNTPILWGPTSTWYSGGPLIKCLMWTVSWIVCTVPIGLKRQSLVFQFADGEGNSFLTLYLQVNGFSWLVVSWELLGPRGLGVGAEVKNTAKTCCLTVCLSCFNFFPRKTSLKRRLFTFFLWDMRVQEELPPKSGKAI